MIFLFIFLGVFLLVCKIASDWLIHTNEREYKPQERINKQVLFNKIENMLGRMNGREFEEFCYFIFSQIGYKAQLTQNTRDGGKDIILYEDGQRIYVECKHYSENNHINTTHIHKLISVCVNDNIKNAIFITTSSYTKDALELIDNCKAVNINRWYKDDLFKACEDIDIKILYDWVDCKYLNLATV